MMKIESYLRKLVKSPICNFLLINERVLWCMSIILIIDMMDPLSASQSTIIIVRGYENL